MVTFKRYMFNRVDMIYFEVDGWPCTSANCYDTDVVNITYFGTVPVISCRDSGIAINSKDADTIIDTLKAANHPIQIERVAVPTRLEMVK